MCCQVTGLQADTSRQDKAWQTLYPKLGVETLSQFEIICLNEVKLNNVCALIVFAR